MADEGELRFAPGTLTDAQGRLAVGPEGPAYDQAGVVEQAVTIGPFGQFDSAPAAVDRLKRFAGDARTDLGTVRQEIGALAQASGAAADEATGWREESARIASSVGPVVAAPAGGN
jgi:hypothetical protein